MCLKFSPIRRNELGRGTGGGHAAPNPPDFYRLLQVDPDAPEEVVVEAYWHLAGRLQSSRQAVPALREHLNALNEAYATLVNSERRKAYDAVLPRVSRLRQERARAIQAVGCRRWPAPPARRAPWRRTPRLPDYYAALCVDPRAEPAIIELAYSVLRLLQSNGPGRGTKE